MKIGTWNIERLKVKKRLPQIVKIINQLDADILVLTETDERVALPQYNFKLYTDAFDEDKKSEHKVCIFSKYPINETIPSQTSNWHFYRPPLSH